MTDTELQTINIERQPFPPEYLLDRVEELAVKVYGLTNERDELEMKLAAVTAERDALKAELEVAMMDPNTVFETPKPSAVDAFVELHEKYGQYFDTIEDVDEWVKKQRRGEE